ncbi:MAG: hypothetical protein ACO3A2_09750 [Bdellovibrionia bacterium]
MKGLKLADFFWSSKKRTFVSLDLENRAWEKFWDADEKKQAGMTVVQFQIVLLSVFFAFLSARSAFAVDSDPLPTLKRRPLPVRLSRPYALPQTGFQLFNYQKQIRFHRSPGNNVDVSLLSGGFSPVGYEIETPALSFLNLGSFFRVYSLSDEPGSFYPNASETSLELGGFLKAYYAPVFLSLGPFMPSVFSRLDLSLSPSLWRIGQSFTGGLMLSGGAHVGFELYVTKWVGVSFSYGRILGVGQVLTSGSLVGGSSISNSAEIYTLGLKTTWF